MCCTYVSTIKSVFILLDGSVKLILLSGTCIVRFLLYLMCVLQYVA